MTSPPHPALRPLATITIGNNASRPFAPRNFDRLMPAERLLLTSDCEFSAIPRWLARKKLQALATGAALMRQETELIGD